MMDWLTLSNIESCAVIAGTLFAAYQLFYARKALQRSAEANELSKLALERSAEANEQGRQALQRSADANEHAAEAGDVSQLMVVLQIENQLAEARLKLIETRIEMGMDESQLELGLKALQEHYLNALDRFCHCVRLGLVEETTYRKDYRTRVTDALKEHPQFFGESSPFQHIKSVNAAWAGDGNGDDYYDARIKARRQRLERWMKIRSGASGASN